MYNHHAVLLLSESLALSGYVPSPADEIFSYGTLSISDVRTIIKSAYGTSLTADAKTMLIETRTIATEAQQALLKIFEEPPQGTKFVLVIPSIEGLLPTLLSRLYRPETVHLVAHSTNPFFTIFQSSSYAARLECITRITKDKDIEQIELLRKGVLWLLSKKPMSSQAAQLAYCVNMLNQRGASKKMLLEEIALLLPTEVN
jgi:hypothetical protein